MLVPKTAEYIRRSLADLERSSLRQSNADANLILQRGCLIHALQRKIPMTRLLLKHNSPRSHNIARNTNFPYCRWTTYWLPNSLRTGVTTTFLPSSSRKYDHTCPCLRRWRAKHAKLSDQVYERASRLVSFIISRSGRRSTGAGSTRGSLDPNARLL